MIIILEGPDGAGKTTLAKTLSRQTGYPIVHFEQPKDMTAAEMRRMYVKAIAEHENAIFDRCWYSEMVYGKVMRDKSLISTDDMQDLETGAAMIRGTMLVYCKAPINLMWTNCKERGEDFIKTFKDYCKICYEYDRVMIELQHKIPVLSYNYEINS